MARVHRNNFRTTLNGAITNVATAITLNDSFAAISAGETLSLTIYGGGLYEIISIPFAGIGTAPAYTSASRGQEGTTGLAWADGSKVECRITRDSIDTVSKVVLIDTKIASASATLDFTSLGDYSKIYFILNDLKPATDNQRLYIRTSTNNGVAYDAGASDYSYVFQGATTTPADGGTTGANGATEIHTCSGVGNDTNELLNGEVNLYNPSSANFKMLDGHINSVGATAIPQFNYFSGFRKSAADVDAIRFLFASGNIASGTIYAYGVKKS